MALKLSKSNSSKLSTRPLTSTYPKQAMFGNHHATVNCNVCHRTMVPRVVSYYGQPLRSICPFCGTTFMKFPSGFQRFVQGFQQRALSFDVFNRLVICALGFGLLWFASLNGILPNFLVPIAILGTSILTPLVLAELLYQCVEQLANKLSHESNYYWAALVLIGIITANTRHDLTIFIVLFSFVMVIRAVIAGVAQARSAPCKWGL